MNDFKLDLYMRLDKFTWAVRLYKTRSMAAKACSAGKVKVNNEIAKAGKMVAIGQEISIKVNPVWRSFKILDFPKSRVGAALLPQFIKETTAEAVLQQLETHQFIQRQNRGNGLSGRPTKKDRRNLDELQGK